MKRNASKRRTPRRDLHRSSPARRVTRPLVDSGPPPAAWWSIALMAAAFLVMPLDRSLVDFLQIENWPGDLQRAMGLSEFFAHGFGITVILLAVFLLDPRHRRLTMGLVANQLVTSLVVHLLKGTIVRLRPSEFLNGTWPTDRTFLSWCRWLDPEFQFSWNLPSPLQSFPSGHSAAVVALALGLSWRYPRGTWLFVAAAALGCLQRVVFHAHWPSDVLMGAGLGWLISSCLIPVFASRLRPLENSNGLYAADSGQ